MISNQEGHAYANAQVNSLLRTPLELVGAVTNVHKLERQSRSCKSQNVFAGTGGVRSPLVNPNIFPDQPLYMINDK